MEHLYPYHYQIPYKQGQITLKKELRQHLGLEAGHKVEFVPYHFYHTYLIRKLAGDTLYPTSTVSLKGQISLPKKVRNYLHLDDEKKIHMYVNPQQDIILAKKLEGDMVHDVWKKSDHLISYPKFKQEFQTFFKNKYASLHAQCSHFHFEGAKGKKEREEFEHIVSDYLRKEPIHIMKQEKEIAFSELIHLLWKDLFGLGPLDDVLYDDTFSEIMINGFDQCWVQSKEEAIQANHILNFESKEALEEVILKIYNSLKNPPKPGESIVDYHLSDFRISIIWDKRNQPRGPLVSIQKFSPIHLTPEGLLALGTASQEMVDFLHMAVRGGFSMALAGATGTGKTTLLKLVAGWIPFGERTFVVEKNGEMKLEDLYPYHQGYHFSSVESHQENETFHMENLLDIGQQLRYSRFIMDDIRKGTELSTVLDASDKGYPVWFAMHARSAKHVYQRMVMMLHRAHPEMNRKLMEEFISRSLDIVIQHRMYHHDKRKRMTEIVEIGWDEVKQEVQIIPLFEWDVNTQQFVKRHSISPRLVEKLRQRGISIEEIQPFL